MRSRKLAIVAIGLVVLAACARQEEEVTPEGAEGTGEMSLEIGSVRDSVEGNVVTLPVEIQGVEIVKPDGDTSGETGHFHIFVDGDPVEVGEVMPRERDIVHSAENPIKIYGLEPGEHEFTVVVGNGVHERILEDLEDSATVDVEGPSVRGTVPATAEEGEDVTVELEAEGVDIVAADGKTSEDSGHFHVLVDPKQPPEAGDVIPEPEEGKIYHSPEDSVTIKGLDKGEHTIWVVLGDGEHKAFDPPVMDKLTVTVE